MKPKPGVYLGGKHVGSIVDIDIKLPGLPSLPGLPNLQIPNLPTLEFSIEIPEFAQAERALHDAQRAVDLWAAIDGEVCSQRSIYDAIDAALRDGELNGDELSAMLAHYGYALQHGIERAHIKGLQQRTAATAQGEFTFEAVSLHSPLAFTGRDWAQLDELEEAKEIDTPARRLARTGPPPELTPEEADAEFDKLEELLK